MDEHATMRKLIERYADSLSLPPLRGEGQGGGLDGDDWLQLKRHLASCAACARYLATIQRLEGALAYRPPLPQPLGFVNAVLRALPPALASHRAQASWRGRVLVAALAVTGLLLMCVPDTYLLTQLGTWLSDIGGAVSNAGQGLSDWVSNPSIDTSGFASELFTQHQTVLLGLCMLTVALFTMLYQALNDPLPAYHHAGRTNHQ